MKRIGLVLLITGFWFLVTGYYTYAQDETLTLVTYYPAPYGVYKQIGVMGPAVTGVNCVPPSTNMVGIDPLNPDTLVLMNIGVPSNTVPDGSFTVPALLQVGGIFLMPSGEEIPSTIYRAAIFGTADAGIAGIGTADASVGVYGLASGNVSITQGQTNYPTGVMGTSDNGIGVSGEGGIMAFNGRAIGKDTQADIYGISIDANNVSLFPLTSNVYGGNFNVSSSSCFGYSVFGLRTNVTNSGSATVYGGDFDASNTSASDSSAGVFGIRAKASQKAGNIYGGDFTATTSEGETISATTYGIRTQTTNNGTGTAFGISNSTSTQGIRYAIGINNTTSVTSNTTTEPIEGILNLTTGNTNTKYAYGFRNTVTGSKELRGIINNVTSNGNEDIYGIENIITSIGSGNVYGIYSTAITSIGSGNVYGIYSTASGSGTNVWAGYFVGNVHVTGQIQMDADEPLAGGKRVYPGGGGAVVGPGDVAELVQCDIDVTLADVVSIGPSKNKFIKSTAQNDMSVAGIISENPTLAFGNKKRYEENNPDSNYKYLALAGLVYCNADASYGEIKPGDLLTTSPTPGHAMKANPVGEINGYPIYPQGCIVGKALEPLVEGKGKILVLVCLM